MNRFVAVVIACAMIGGHLRAEESPKSAEVKKLATSMVEATLKGEYAKVIDHTYSKVVDLLGGREAAIKTTETAMKQIKDQGLVIKEFKVGEPGEFVSDETNTFVVIPTNTEMTLPLGTVKMKSYLLGISPDKGKTWTFIDGSGLQNSTFKEKILPKVPEKLKLPELAKPEIIPNKK